MDLFKNKQASSWLGEAEALQKDIDVITRSIENSTAKQTFFEDMHIGY